MFTLNSRDLRMWSSMIASRMISLQNVIVKSRQVLHPFPTLYSWGQRSRCSKESRTYNERDCTVMVFDALGKYKCDTGISVEEVPAIVNIKTLKGRLIAHKFNTGWALGVVNSGKEEEYCWPVCSQV